MKYMVVPRTVVSLGWCLSVVFCLLFTGCGNPSLQREIKFLRAENEVFRAENDDFRAKLDAKKDEISRLKAQLENALKREDERARLFARNNKSANNTQAEDLFGVKVQQEAERVCSGIYDLAKSAAEEECDFRFIFVDRAGGDPREMTDQEKQECIQEVLEG